jgi:diacylglycerol kinase (ATP)
VRICLIINPTAGQSKPGSALAEIKTCITEWCPDLTVRETDSKGAGERLAREIKAGEFDMVVAAGGDGTINEVLNGLGDHTPLGLLPLGTANVLARELKIPVNDIAGACNVLKTCPPIPTDMGLCNNRRFSLMVGIGFDAQAVKEVEPEVKNRVGALAYALSALKALTRMRRALRFRLFMENRKLFSRGMMLVVANAGNYAGDLQIAPMASIDDGMLDLCLFRERSKLAFVGQWLLVLMRKQLEDPHFTYVRARQVRVECKPPAAVQLDGDYFGRTPVEIRVLPGAVRIIRPAPAAQ